MDALPDGSNPSFQLAPRTVVLSFDLILSGPWAGNTPGSQSYFQVSGNGTTSLLSTFSTTAAAQSYPNSFGGGSSPAGTGATEFNPGGVSDYRIQTTFPLYLTHLGGADLSINFTASGLDPTAGWQLDNVNIDWNQPVPEPSGFILLALGMALYMAKNIFCLAQFQRSR